MTPRVGAQHLERVAEVQAGGLDLDPHLAGPRRWRRHPAKAERVEGRAWLKIQGKVLALDEGGQGRLGVRAQGLETTHKTKPATKRDPILVAARRQLPHQAGQRLGRHLRIQVDQGRAQRRVFVGQYLPQAPDHRRGDVEHARLSRDLHRPLGDQPQARTDRGAQALGDQAQEAPPSRLLVRVGGSVPFATRWPGQEYQIGRARALATGQHGRGIEVLGVDSMTGAQQPVHQRRLGGVLLSRHHEGLGLGHPSQRRFDERGLQEAYVAAIQRAQGQGPDRQDGLVGRI